MGQYKPTVVTLKDLVYNVSFIFDQEQFIVKLQHERQKLNGVNINSLAQLIRYEQRSIYFVYLLLAVKPAHCEFSTSLQVPR